MKHIFISYSHSDSLYAHRLASSLEESGFTVWIDDRIDYGEQWPRVIQEELDNCGAFVVIMTPRSFESEWVQNELSRAKRKKKTIFPILLEGDGPWLSVESVQNVEIVNDTLPPEKFYKALAKLLPRAMDVSRVRLSSKIVLDSAGKFERKIVSDDLQSIIIGMVNKALCEWRLPSKVLNMHDLLDSYAWEQGITDPQSMENAIALATDLLGRTERCKVVTHIQQASQVFRDWAFTLFRDPYIVDGSIDVLFYSNEGKWSFVSYKTTTFDTEDYWADEHFQEKIEVDVTRYYSQIAVYALAVEEFTGHIPDVYIHYIPYVHTYKVKPELWQSATHNLDEIIAADLIEQNGKNARQ